MRALQKMVLLQLIGGIIGLLGYILLFFLLLKTMGSKKKFNQNFTAWMLGALIDFLLWLLIKKENGNYALPLAYMAGSLIIAFLLLYKKKFQWRPWRDAIVIVIVATCLFIGWQTGNEKIVIVVGVLASVVSFTPQIRDTAKNPKETPMSVYLIFLFGDFISLLGGRDNSVQERMYSFTELILSIVILSLILYSQTTVRRKK